MEHKGDMTLISGPPDYQNREQLNCYSNDNALSVRLSVCLQITREYLWNYSCGYYRSRIGNRFSYPDSRPVYISTITGVSRRGPVIPPIPCEHLWQLALCCYFVQCSAYWDAATFSVAYAHIFSHYANKSRVRQLIITARTTYDRCVAANLSTTSFAIASCLENIVNELSTQLRRV